MRYSTGSEAATLHVPPGATDCHFHIYDNRFPPAPGGLPAPDATPDDYRALQARLGTARGVVIQPSLYGVNNQPTLDGMAALGPNFRAVAVVNTAVTDAELRRLHGFGVRGIRFNLAQPGTTTLDMLEPLSSRVDALGWHCQINMPGDKIAAAADTFLRVRGKLVFDHLAHCPQPAGVESDTFKLIRRLLGQGNTWVKLTGLYNETKVGPPSYSDSVAVAWAFAAAAPDRVVWGTDWPHPTEKPGQQARRRVVARPARDLRAGRGGAQARSGGQPGPTLRFPGWLSKARRLSRPGRERVQTPQHATCAEQVSPVSRAEAPIV